MLSYLTFVDDGTVTLMKCCEFVKFPVC